MFLILVVSRLVRHKNLEAGIKATQRLKEKNLRLVIAGDGPDRKRLETLANQQVEFKGDVRGAELDKLYSACDLVLYPVIWEPFGLVPIEAMRHGKPIVCSQESGVAEIINEARCGFLIDPRNIADIAEKIAILMGDEGLRKKMGKNGRRYYIQHMSRDRFVLEFERILVGSYG